MAIGKILSDGLFRKLGGAYASGYLNDREGIDMSDEPSVDDYEGNEEVYYGSHNPLDNLPKIDRLIEQENSKQVIDPYIFKKLEDINVNDGNIVSSIKKVTSNVDIVNNKIELLGKSVSKNIHVSNALIQYNKNLSDALKTNKMKRSFDAYQRTENAFERNNKETMNIGAITFGTDGSDDEKRENNNYGGNGFNPVDLLKKTAPDVENKVRVPPAIPIPWSLLGIGAIAAVTMSGGPLIQGEDDFKKQLMESKAYGDKLFQGKGEEDRAEEFRRVDSSPFAMPYHEGLLTRNRFSKRKNKPLNAGDSLAFDPLNLPQDQTTPDINTSIYFGKPMDVYSIMDGDKVSPPNLNDPFGLKNLDEQTSVQTIDPIKPNETVEGVDVTPTTSDNSELLSSSTALTNSFIRRRNRRGGTFGQSYQVASLQDDMTDYFAPFRGEDISQKHERNIEEAEKSGEFATEKDYQGNFDSYSITAKTFDLKVDTLTFDASKNVEFDASEEIVIKSSQSITLDAPTINVLGTLNTLNNPGNNIVSDNTSLGYSQPNQGGGFDGKSPIQNLTIPQGIMSSNGSNHALTYTNDSNGNVTTAIPGNAPSFSANQPENVKDVNALLNLIGKTEGTDRGRGYNETLGYGRYTGGDVDLTSMTLSQIYDLQTQMLRNGSSSSALGRYQIIRTTLFGRGGKGGLVQEMGLNMNQKFTPELQDQMAVHLLKRRGLNQWLNGKLATSTFMNNLSDEWASLPNAYGSGSYAGQRTGTSVGGLSGALDQVKQDYFTNHYNNSKKEDTVKPFSPREEATKVAVMNDSSSKIGDSLSAPIKFPTIQSKPQERLNPPATGAPTKTPNTHDGVNMSSTWLSFYASSHVS